MESFELKGKIVGRKKEQDVLKGLLSSQKAEFLAVYGRRRVGKTYLIKNFMDNGKSTFFHMTGLKDGTMRAQIAECNKQIGEAFYNGTNLLIEKSWMKTFEQINLAIKQKKNPGKIVLFFDEFPWMATPRSGVLSALELYWNRYWSFDQRIVLIVCGSSTSWIIEKIINNRGGLHNRVTRTMELIPFSLAETSLLLEEYGITMNNRQVLELYTVIGGVPLYWSYIKKGKSASQCIDELCFQRGGPLVKEFDRLFDSLFDDSEPYKALMRAIARHRYGIKQTDLLKETKMTSGGHVVRRLNQLEEVGFISGHLPYGHKEKGVHYVVDDEYCLFYFHWIEPNRRSIEKQKIDPGFWEAQSLGSSWASWAGLAFEAICFKHLRQIRSALGIPSGSIAHTWRYLPGIKKAEPGAQIDLLFDRPDDVITVCEIKRANQQFAIDKPYAQSLSRKLEVFKEKTQSKKQLFLAMITLWGLKPTKHSEGLVTNEAKLEDMFG